MSRKHIELIGPHGPYDVCRQVTPSGTALTVLDRQHTPYNKRQFEVNASAEFVVQNGPEWVSFQAEEIVHHESGRSAKRVISIHMPREIAEALARHILTGNRNISG